jgi:hypothetical protein
MKRVLLIHPEGNTFNNPTLKSVVDLLLDKKVHVTIRYQLGLSPMPVLPGVLLLPVGRIQQKIKNAIFNRLCWEWLAYLYVWLEQIFIYQKYDLTIGVDRQGLIEAGMLYQQVKTPYVFFSFEIMFESETSKHFKSTEKNMAQHVKQWFVQDEIRALHLQKENGLNPANKTLLPLASSGAAEKHGERLRDLLGVPVNRKVAIAIGSISDWSMVCEIVSSVLKWPEDWVLIIHDRYGQTETELAKLGCNLNVVPKGRIFLSSHACMQVDNMSNVLAGISAGLALYRPNYKGPYTGENLKYLGLASGKISTYLRYGVPPVMNDIGQYSSLAKTHQFGLVAEDADGIGTLLESLIDPAWSARAHLYYKEHLDFNIYRDMVWEKLCEAELVN